MDATQAGPSRSSTTSRDSLTTAPDSGTGASAGKQPIPRNSSRTWKPKSPKTRILHACDQCRVRRAKCTGERPTCQPCADTKRTCTYSDKKRKREQLRTEQLEARVRQCEDLLRHLEPLQDAANKESIHRVLEGWENESPHVTPSPSDHRPSRSRSRSHTSAKRKASFVSQTSSSRSPHIDSKSDTSYHRLLEDINTLSINQSTGFLGRVSDEAWLSNIYNYLRGTAPNHGPHVRPAINDDEIVTTYYVDDQDISLSGRQVDHLLIPPKWVADTLVQVYFVTMHDLIPMIEKQDFLKQYNDLYFAADPPDPSGVPWGWLSILNVVFAIGQAHMDLKNDWEPERSTHVEYFLRARILGALDGGLVFEAATLQDVQVMGLSAIYLLATKQVNRAWNAIGLAVRLGQGLGLHFAKSALTLTTLQKEMRLRVWYSLYYIDSVVCLATGRPPGIQNRDCQAPLPRTILDDERGTYCHYPSGDPCPYFTANHELLLLIAEITDYMYVGRNPDLSPEGWRKTAGIIAKLEGRLDRWRARLPEQLEFTSYRLSLGNASQRMDLALFYYNARILILQPTVVPLLTAHPNPSPDFLELLATSQRNCIGHAQEIIKLMLEEWDIDRRLSTIPWWCFLHYLGCAEAILMAALLYGTTGHKKQSVSTMNIRSPEDRNHVATNLSDNPGASEISEPLRDRAREMELVEQCKLGIRWMREVSQRSLAGQRCCVRLSKCLSGVVRRIGLEDMGVEGEEIRQEEVRKVFAGPSDFLLRMEYD